MTRVRLMVMTGSSFGVIFFGWRYGEGAASPEVGGQYSNGLAGAQLWRWRLRRTVIRRRLRGGWVWAIYLGLSLCSTPGYSPFPREGNLARRRRNQKHIFVEPRMDANTREYGESRQVCTKCIRVHSWFL